MGELFQRLAQELPERRESMLSFMLQQKSRREKMPISLQIEITPFCTLSCKMCYVVEESHELKSQVLRGDQWIDLIAQAVDMGVFNVTISGGECTLHPEFKRIYAAAYDMGCDVTIITNATLINKQLVEFFLEKPPKRICITMYGFSEETYAYACGNGKAFEIVKNAVLSIKNAGLTLALQSTVTVDTYQDVPQIARFAYENGISFYYTHTLKANRKCDVADVLELSISEEQQKWIDAKVYEYTGLEKKEPPLCEMLDKDDEQKFGTECGAGNSLFHINWKGELTPCVTFEPVVAYPLTSSVREAWEIIRDYCAQIPRKLECRKCHFYNRCQHCVALHWGDTDNFDQPALRLCWKMQHPEQAQREEIEYMAQHNNLETK